MGLGIRHGTLPAIGILGMAMSVPATAAGQQSQSQPAQRPARLPKIEVIGVTPVHGVGIPKDQFPANVQSASGQEIEKSHSVGLGDYMNQRLGSVYVNEAQSNPLQPNVSYRGFTVSPLLGLPQGLAVYQNGVRINEPFGDTVNFSLIPQSAISSIELIPGSNPVFGRNALGGALSIETKSGLSDPGTGGEAYYGSFDRYFLQAQTGGHHGQFNYFLTGEYFDENGWRDFSPSRAKRIFGKLGWQGIATALNLSITAADTDLIGNGAAPVQLLDIDRSAIFTRPDQTESALAMFNLSGSHQLSDDLLIEGNAYFRRNDIDTRNGDDSDYASCEQPANEGLLCSGVEDGVEEVVHDTSSDPVQAAPAVLGGTDNTSRTDQDGYGGNIQLTFLQNLFDRQNQLIVGAAVDRADINFQSQTELATLDSTRLARGSGIIDRGSLVSANIDTLDYGIYFTDTWSVTSALVLTISGRYNHTHIDIDDRIGTALNGEHSLDHFNPAIGAGYQLIPEFGVYARYSVANRTPTPGELTCADPTAPCRLPNDFVSDPNLDQVIAKTVEVGARGRWNHINWAMALFRTVNHDDIQFISAGKLQNTGFFKNVGETRHQGVELTLNGRYKHLDWFLDYTYLQAQFRDPFTARSSNNPFANAQDEIQVQSGDRIPGVPRHLFKMGADYSLTPAFTLGATLLYTSDKVLRGDESNQLKPIGGYTLVNLRGQYQITDQVVLFGQVDNLFDKKYATFGDLADAGDVLGDQFDNPRFLSPGAPRAGWFGARVAF